MRIAHLDTGRTWRGGQAQVLLLMRGLRARGHDGVLLAPAGPLLEKARAEGLEAVRWRPLTEWDPVAAWVAARVFARVRPDVVHCHSAHAQVPGVVAARHAGVAATVVSRRVDFAVATHPLSRLKYRLPVDRYFCISRGVMEVMAAAGIPRRRLALVPSGIELPARDGGAPGTDPADLRALIGAPPNTPVVGTVAALAPHKNHADLLEAAARVARARPGVRFAWIGEGECRPDLERRRRALGLEGVVHLLGFRADARSLMRQFTVFALASWLEGLCTSLLDAQARGVPVVATAVGGIPEVVQDGVSGRLVAERDPEALAGALIEALDHPERCRAWAEQGLRAVEAFGAHRMVERSLEEYAVALRWGA
ncbi:MAG: hypothetical protein A2W00_07040 [Candidatus Eisenbacteria bacterium RBG_16_71_46]|nr:MAG: hypothetical protein A2W00_07040 [Candidatus Eisenbacteria bacterium RBG_16_71_46]